jgi:hypothetical protein
MSLLNLKERLESMSESHQDEILKIFIESSIQMSENSNGTFINLSLVPPEIIEKLEKYAEYVDEQTKELESIEYEKEQLKTTFFSNNL